MRLRALMHRRLRRPHPSAGASARCRLRWQRGARRDQRTVAVVAAEQEAQVVVAQVVEGLEAAAGLLLSVEAAEPAAVGVA